MTNAQIHIILQKLTVYWIGENLRIEAGNMTVRELIIGAVGIMPLYEDSEFSPQQEEQIGNYMAQLHAIIQRRIR